MYCVTTYYIKDELIMVSNNLTLLFKNNTMMSDEDVYITFQNPALGNTNMDVSYSDGTAQKQIKFASQSNLMSTSLSLKDIGDNGLSVAKMASAIVYVSYGKPLKSTTTAPSYIGKGGDDYGTKFQPFELTRLGNRGDQGNMTAINYFTATMAIKSFNGGVKGTLLQSKSYNTDSIDIGNKIAKLTDDSSLSAVKNLNGDIIRYIGPSSYGPYETNPFGSLAPYLKSIMDAGQSTEIINNNAFNQPAAAGEGSTNYNYSLNLTATIDADDMIKLDGSISTMVTPFGGKPSAGTMFNDCSITISTKHVDILNYVLYGQVIDNDIVTFGPGWAELGKHMKSIGIDTQGALDTTKNLAMGEITSGLLMGFVNSPVMPSGMSVAIKDMSSDEWWKLKPVMAFSDLQPSESTDYNQYANVLYSASGNEVYSIPYSDRLGTGPLINSVQFNDQEVDTWEVTLDPPIENLL